MAAGEYVAKPHTKYIATENSLYEFVKTSNLVTKPLLVQRAVKAMFEYNAEIIPVSPFGYVLYEHSDKFGWNTNFTDKVILTLQEFISLEQEEILKMTNSDISELARQCDEANEQNRNFQNAMTVYVNNLRRDQNKIDTSRLARNFCLAILNDAPECHGLRISESEIDWRIVELFLAVTQNYLGKMLKIKTMKVDENDSSDWINTLYVQPGQKYLTFDKRWKSLINEDPRIRSYAV